MATAEGASIRSIADNTGARRSINKNNALRYAAAGLYVFPSSGKVPLVPVYQKADHAISDEEREAAIAKYTENHDGKRPVHVGATRDAAVVKAMWRAFPDAVCSISTGPSKLVVVDADTKDNGPALLAELWAEHGGAPENAVVSTTRSGGSHTIFADPEGRFSNSAGLMKSKYGCDIRGAGGQFVAPGSIREDGKTYGNASDMHRLRMAVAEKTLPTLPDFIVELIGTRAVDSEQPVNDSDPAIRDLLEQLCAETRDDFASLFDDTVGRFPLDFIRQCRPDFGFFYDHPGDDRSANRMKVATFLVGAYPELRVTDYAVFCSEWDAAGDPDDRQLAREFRKATLRPAEVRVQSQGDAFEVVDDEDDGAESDRAKVDRLRSRIVYIEHLRNAALRVLDWCVKFFIARGTTSVATGLWGSGKTAVFSDIGLHVGHGFEWRGRKVRKGVVIYVALENSDDVERRVSTWCNLMEQAGRDVTNGAFVLHRGPCSLFDQGGRPTRDEKDLVEIAKTAAKHYGLPVAMIVIDTLAQSMAPGDDNSAKDAGIYTAALQRIAATTGANVTALAHPIKTGEGVRGSGALQANVDTVISLTRDSSGRGTIAAGSKFRIGNPAKVKFGYRLKSHVIGQDEDGDDIDVVLAVDEPGAVMGPVDDAEDDAIPAPTDGPEDKLQAALRALEWCARGAADATGDDPREVGVSAGQVFRRLNLDRKAAGLEELKDRSIMPRLLGKLVDRGEVVKTGDNRRTEYRLS